MLGPHLEVVQRTDPGRDPNKQVNEDAAGYHATRLGHLLVVCDGMGGHALGQEASQLALRTIVQMVENAPPGTRAGAALAAAIAQAGRLVYQMGGAGPQMGRPGSTCVAALVHAAGAEIAHVGDSRAYLFRRGQIWQVTKDHSVVQQMIDAGALTPDQAVAHPEANKITRALGMKQETEVDLREPAILYEPDDILVLATDGLCDLIRTEEIGGILAHASNLEAAGDELVRTANGRGGHDNITVQLARVTTARMFHPGAGTEGAPTPTLVEPIAGMGPEKTVVDPVVLATAPPTTIPQVPAVPHSPAIPHVAPHLVALPQPPPGPPPVRTHPGAPSPGGVLALVLGFAAVGLILVGVVVWWFLRGQR